MTNNTKKLNPLFSIWTQPRATIQQIIDTNPKHLVISLMILYGALNILSQPSYISSEIPISINQDLKIWLFHNMQVIFLLLTVIIGTLLGLIILYLGGLLLYLTGKILGGKASAEHLRTALAWSFIPQLLSTILLILTLSLFNYQLLEVSEAKIASINDTSISSVIAIFTPSIFHSIQFIFQSVVIPIWSIIILSKCLGQVQNFSAWKGLVNIILSFLLLIFISFMAFFMAYSL